VQFVLVNVINVKKNKYSRASKHEVPDNEATLDDNSELDDVDLNEQKITSNKRVHKKTDDLL